MGKLLAAFILTLLVSFTSPDLSAHGGGPEGVGEKCQIYSAKIRHVPPGCFADMHMIASRPELYCDRHVIVFGYLDYEDLVFYPSKESADAKFIEVSATIIGDEVSAALGKNSPPGKIGDYVTLKGRFRCISDMEDWPGAGIGEIFDVELITHYDRNDKSPKESVIFRDSSGRAKQPRRI